MKFHINRKLKTFLLQIYEKLKIERGKLKTFLWKIENWISKIEDVFAALPFYISENFVGKLL